MKKKNLFLVTCCAIFVQNVFCQTDTPIVQVDGFSYYLYPDGRTMIVGFDQTNDTIVNQPHEMLAILRDLHDRFAPLMKLCYVDMEQEIRLENTYYPQQYYINNASSTSLIKDSTAVTRCLKAVKKQNGVHSLIFPDAYLVPSSSY